MTSRIEVFYTSILANPKVRSNTEKVERFLFKIPHQKYDIASMSCRSLPPRRYAVIGIATTTMSSILTIDGSPVVI